MSDETRAALHAAIDDHMAAGGPGNDADRNAIEAAARAHLDDVDPEYEARHSIQLAPGHVLTLEPHQRMVLPEVQAEYNDLLELAGTRDAPQDERMRELADELAAASQARRILEGRPLTTGAALTISTSPEA